MTQRVIRKSSLHKKQCEKKYNDARIF